MRDVKYGTRCAHTCLPIVRALAAVLVVVKGKDLNRTHIRKNKIRLFQSVLFTPWFQL